MADAHYLPEDWTTMRDAVYAWAAEEVAPVPVVWSKQLQPPPEKPCVYLSLLSAPIWVGMAEHIVVGLAIDITELQPNAAYTVTVDENTTVTVTTGATPNVVDLRDAIVEALQAEGNLSNIDVRRIDLTALNLNRRGSTEGPRLVVSDNLVVKSAHMVVAEAICVFQVDAYADGDDGSVPLSTALRLSLESPDVYEKLKAAGWGSRVVTGDRHIDTPVAERWEDRTGFDVRLGCIVRRTKLIDYIQSFDAYSTSLAGVIGEAA